MSNLWESRKHALEVSLKRKINRLAEISEELQHWCSESEATGKDDNTLRNDWHADKLKGHGQYAAARLLRLGPNGHYEILPGRKLTWKPEIDENENDFEIYAPHKYKALLIESGQLQEETSNIETELNSIPVESDRAGLPKPTRGNPDVKKTEFPSPPGLKWSEVKIIFDSNDWVRVIARETAKRYSYSQLGFGDTRTTDKPMKAWVVLQGFAQYHGKIPWENNLPKSVLNNLQKKIGVIRKILKTLMGIDDDPFYPYKKESGWTTKFRILKSHSTTVIDGPEIQENSRSEIADVYKDEIGSREDQTNRYEKRRTIQTRIDDYDDNYE
jgi:hypothetical protein